MANLNSILPNRKQNQQRGYSKEAVKEAFDTSEIKARVASDVMSVNGWDNEKRQRTQDVDHQYVYLEFPSGDPFRVKFPANTDLASIKFGETVETIGLEACNFFDYATHKRETYFRAKSLKKIDKQ